MDILLSMEIFLSLMTIKKSCHKVPCYTQICRRMKKLQLPTELLNKQEVTDIVLDTTGLKAYGEGEWRVEKYGGKKSWRKLHLVLDLQSRKLILAEATQEHVHDTSYLKKALKKSNHKKRKLLIDGIGDSYRCYELAKKYKKQLLTLPTKRAVYRRVIAESMMTRWKKLYGEVLKSHCEERKRIEVTLKAIMINEMIETQAP